jgi:5-methylcytosine-specific restriction endonuclease McrA
VERQGQQKIRKREAAYNSKRKRRAFQRLIDRDGPLILCPFCGREIDVTLRDESKWSATIDHIKPLRDGGNSTLENLRLAHRYCNGFDRRYGTMAYHKGLKLNEISD